MKKSTSNFDFLKLRFNFVCWKIQFGSAKIVTSDDVSHMLDFIYLKGLVHCFSMQVVM